MTKINFIPLKHHDDGDEAQYCIRISDEFGDPDAGSEFVISLRELRRDRPNELSPQLHVFEDGLPALQAFTLGGALTKVMANVSSPDVFEYRLRDAGIWAVA